MGHVSILVVDDESTIREVVVEFLSGLNYEVFEASDGQAALDSLDLEAKDIVMSDIMMPRLDGFALLREIKTRFPDTQVLMMTGFGSIESAVEAMRLGAAYYVTKPLNFNLLKEKLVRVVHQQELLREVAHLARQTEESDYVTELERENAAVLVRQLAVAGEKLKQRNDQILELSLLLKELKSESADTRRPFQGLIDKMDRILQRT
ncbi:MAG: response regulator [Proteobacteria bacterium]|nr:response regulator [Pseudomonadota bacterium]